ncbi:MAG: hypothetical protein DELT_01726 [Desulfovibrio sp.]
MQSLIHLYNTALAKLGGDQLPQNISPIESNALGALCQNVFPHILDMALEAHEWHFASKRAVLAQVASASSSATGAANPLYAYRYMKPADCITPIGIAGQGAVLCPESEDGSPAYVLEGSVILCNVAQAELVYTSRFTDPKRWPAYFAEHLVWKLAATLAIARNNDKQQQQACERMAEMTLAKACAMDRKTANPYRKPSAWQAARGTGGRAAYGRRAYGGR